MTDLDLDKLEAVAKAASRDVTPDSYEFTKACNDFYRVFNQPTVLAMIERLRAWETSECPRCWYIATWRKKKAGATS